MEHVAPVWMRAIDRMIAERKEQREYHAIRREALRVNGRLSIQSEHESIEAAACAVQQRTLEDLRAAITEEAKMDTRQGEAQAETETRTGLSFGRALKELQNGRLVARAGWNGKNMWLVYVAGSTISTREGTPYAKALGTNYTVTINPHIDMMTAQGTMQPGWLASQTDMLALDWEIVGGKNP